MAHSPMKLSWNGLTWDMGWCSQRAHRCCVLEMMGVAQRRVNLGTSEFDTTCLVTERHSWEGWRASGEATHLDHSPSAAGALSHSQPGPYPGRPPYLPFGGAVALTPTSAKLPFPWCPLASSFSLDILTQCFCHSR